MKKLTIFNIEMDSNSQFLAANIDLVNSFNRHFNDISVYATHVGSILENHQIRIVQLGGGSRFRRIKAAIKLFFAVFRVTLFRNDTIIFYHMVTRIPATVGSYFKWIGIKQYIWYSHSKADEFLARAVNNVDLVFSPTVDSFPLASNKLICVGHGVKSALFPYSGQEVRKGVITVGRVVPIKRIEIFIQQFSSLNRELKERYSPLLIIGDTSIDREYVNSISTRALRAGLDIQFLGQIPRESIPAILNRANFYFLGTPKSIDKASIEAAMCGCVILSENLEAVSILGPSEIPGKGLAAFKSFNQQFETYASLSQLTLKEIQNGVSKKAKSQNELDEVVNRIVDKIK